MVAIRWVDYKWKKNMKLSWEQKKDFQEIVCPNLEIHLPEKQW